MSSSDADTTALGVHAGGHIHGCELLEHELGGVWDDDLCDLGLVLARSALKLVLLERAINALANTFIKGTARGGKTYAIGVIRPQISQT
jgi:hypothetical protein